MALFTVVFSVAPLRAQGGKDIQGDRQVRLQPSPPAATAASNASPQMGASEAWTPARIMLNLDARCPVVTALGYFGAYASSDADTAKAAELQSRYAELLKFCQPLSAQLKKIAVSTTFTGPKFPETLMPGLQNLCGQLYGEISKLYGDEALGELKLYVAAQAEGEVVK